MFYAHFYVGCAQDMHRYTGMSCMQKAEIRVRCLSLSLPTLFLRQALPLNPELTNSANLARDPFISDSPGLVPQCVTQPLALYVGVGDLNLGSMLTCMARPLPTELWAPRS